MKSSLSIAVPLAILGGSAAAALTLLHYAHAHRNAVLGGHLVLLFGAFAIGVLCGVSSYWVSPSEKGALARSIAICMVSAFVAALALSAIISKSSGALS